LKC
ncbi:hypothetical protein TIFTF001_003379, partial [Ficus carica]|jgi:hypothetical protein